MFERINPDYPVEHALKPQLQKIVDRSIKELNIQLHDITEQFVQAGGLGSSGYAIANAECIKTIAEKLFPALAKQIMVTLNAYDSGALPAAVYFNEASIVYINQAFGLVYRDKTNSFSNTAAANNIYKEAKDKLLESREYYANQLSLGFVDGMHWNKLSEQIRVAEITNIYHGNKYHVQASGNQNQFVMEGSIATQNNTLIQNDLQAIQQLIAEIQNSALSETEKEDLSVPLERIVQEAKNGNTDGRFLRTACRELLMRIQSGAYDKLSQAALDGTQAAVEKLLSLAAA